MFKKLFLLLAVAGIVTVLAASAAFAATSVGTQRSDELNGTRYDDTIYGLNGNDEIIGRSGADTLYAGNGFDDVFGGFGRDYIVGGYGLDTIFSGPGNDRIEAADGRQDIVDCGDGFDRASVDAADSVAANCEVINGVEPL